MAEHKDRKEFFEELFHILFKIVPEHADIKKHVAAVRWAINEHKENNRFAEALDELNDTEIEELVRFVERPGGRHHIHEVRKIWDAYGVEQAGRKLLEHFYAHNKSHLIHGRKLRLSFH